MNKSEDFFPFEWVSKPKWEDKVIQDLKGKPLSALAYELEPDISIHALYSKEESPQPFSLTKATENWNFGEFFGAIASNEKVLQALARGINEITVVYHHDLQKQLESVNTEIIRVNLIVSSLEAWAELIASKFIQSLSINYLIFDPLNAAYQTGNALPSDLLPHWQQQTDHLAPLSVDLLHLQQSGATAIQQIGALFATLSDYLEGLTPSQIEKRMQKAFLRIGVSKNYFLEIAKLRAIRFLWTGFGEAHGVDKPLYIHAQTSSTDLSAFDANTNMLRLTTQAMSAILGGADAVSILPFDEMRSEKSPYSNRISRNIHHLLKEESHLDAVYDAVKGSYFLENLTRQLAEKGWEKFLSIEKEGGFLTTLQEGWFQHEVMGTVAEKVKLVKNEKETLIGVNKYPNSLENNPKVTPLPKKEGLTQTIVLDELNLAREIEVAKQGGDHE